MQKQLCLIPLVHEPCNQFIHIIQIALRALPIYLSVFLSMYLSIYLSVLLSLSLSLSLSLFIALHIAHRYQVFV